MHLKFGHLRTSNYAWLEVLICKAVRLCLANDGGSGWKMLGENPRESVHKTPDCGGRLLAIQYHGLEGELEVVYEDRVWEVVLWGGGEVRE